MDSRGGTGIYRFKRAVSVHSHLGHVRLLKAVQNILRCIISGGAAVLSQEFEDGERAIRYYSVKFTPQQQNYSASERECLAVLSAIEKFRPYIEGVNFTVVTDHSALKWLMTMKDPKGRLARWAIRLQAYDMTIVHKPGRHMHLPDALSRAVHLVDIQPESTNDKWYNKMVQAVTEREHDTYKLENGLLYRRLNFTPYSGERLWVVCVPEESREKVLHEQHDDYSHQGVWKVHHRVKTMYYWPGMFETIYQHIKNCETCRLIKPSNENRTTPIGKYRDPGMVGRQLSIDLVGLLPMSKMGNRHLFVVLDCYSRFVFVKPLRHATTGVVISFLTGEVFLRNGCPEIIISDNGKQFTSAAFSEMCAKFHIKHSRTPVAHPKANQVESTNKNIKTALMGHLANTREHSQWENFISKVVIDLNTTPHTSTGQSPFYLNYGREMIRDAREYQILLEANPQRTFEPERMQAVHEEAHETQRDNYAANQQRI